MTLSHTYTKHHFIDTAPLVSRFDVLAEAVLAFTIAGRLGHAIRTSRKIVRLIRTLTTLEGHNAQLKRKLDMLSHKPWRDCVLRELGGLRKLKLWEAAKARIEARATAPIKRPKPQGPAWLYTAERIAESERLKARKRACARASHNPLIMRDKCKLDFEGQFRLAPLPRAKRGPRQMRVYTQNTIIEYDWNPMPFQEEKGFGPAMVWPVEFYAAMKIEAEILAEKTEGNSLQSLPHSPLSFPQTRESNPTEPRLLLNPLFRGDDKEERRGDWNRKDVRKREKTSAPPLSLNDVLSPKVWNDLFSPMPEEVLHAGS